jgi:hypothetical protein
MNIKKIAEKLLIEQKEDNAVILEIFQTGSNVFDVERKKDDDYVVICENYGQRKRREIIIENDIKYDILIMDKKAVEASLDFDDYIYIQNDIKLFSYFYDVSIRKTIYGNSNLNWSMLDHKVKYIDYIKNRFASTKYHMLPEIWKFGKHLVHYYVVLKIYENNKAELTDQMLLDIKALYDTKETSLPIIEWVILNLREPKE